MSNIFSRFIFWLKKIFHIRPELKYEKKELPTKVLPETSPDGKTPEVSVKKKIQKPHNKKPPTKKIEEEREKPSEGEKKPAIFKQKREIDLGGIGRKRPKSTKQAQQTAKVSIEKTEKEPKGKEITTRIESPYVEIDLDEAKIFLIIPEQQLEIKEAPKQLHYNLRINGDNRTIDSIISCNKEKVIVQENRIELEQPLKSFEVVYPKELQSRDYRYQHSNEILYPFIAIGNNRGRLHYLFDEENYNPLPKKDVWILIEEDFKLAVEPEERWIWEKYQPFFINLKNINELVIKNKLTGDEKKIPCESTFTIAGDVLVEDDFKESMPIFTGNSIKIKAPIENPSGWVVWIQNKQAGYKIVAKDWTGDDPLELKLPDDLPCECGEFQIDICEQEDRIPVETLFFRYIPFIQLEFPRDLVIPDPEIGHKKEFVKILLEKDFHDWELKLDENVQRNHIENGYQVELLPEQDILRFSLMKKNKPETEANFKITIPKLRWKVSRNETWHDKPLQLKRDELIAGIDFYLTVCTNDFDTKYNLSAILETNDQRLQKAEFIREGMVHKLLLNQFYDTINKNEGKITLRIGIQKAADERLLGQVDVMHLPEITKEKSRGKSQKQPVSFEPLKKKDIKNMRPNVKCGRGMRKGKGFSRQEIIKAGIDMGDICRLHILFDKRRKSAYSENIEILKSLTGGE